MVHRSGSIHQYEELIAKDDLQIAESLKSSSNSSSNPSNSNNVAGQSEDGEPKRPLRTSKRLCSINPDVMTPPKLMDTSSGSGIIKTKTSTDTLMTFASNLVPLAVKPKPIRNRRYTINDCVRPSEKSNISVPFADQKRLKISSTTDEIFTQPKNSGKSLDDLNIQKDHFNCSVSLERLTGILDAKLSPTSDKDDPAIANKVFCLYCDRTFSSLKLYAKHVERVHQSKSGRRISARTSNTASPMNYPGCAYCNVGKVTCLESEELTHLVHHLIQQHSDKYFACKECLVRFQTRELLQKHASAFHGHTDAKMRKESQRKTPRNVQSITSSSAVTPLTVQVDYEPNEPELNLRNRLRRSTDLKTKSDRSSRRQLFSSEETFLSRLGIGLNRSPRSRKGAKNRRGCSSELFETTRSTRSNKIAKQSVPNSHESNEASKPNNNKTEPIVTTFDEDFYEGVNQNVKLNLSLHLDGKLDSGPMSPSPLSPVASVPTVRSILVKSPLVIESEIHEATTISTFTAFPTLLTAQQHGGESLIPGKIKKPITKNSWKWKWDCVKKYKYVNEGGKMVKKVKQSTCGMRDLSTLDMWTQLTMRMRHEMTTRQTNENAVEDSVCGIGETARDEKRRLIEQLNKILDSRIVPKINVEQNDQSIIKLEAIDDIRNSDRSISSILSHGSTHNAQHDQDFPALMNLIKRERPENAHTNIILSGEWARPRCYICFGCGSLFATIRLLEEHKAVKHPFVHSTHYEIVGKELIDGNLFRNFYIPSLALQRHNEYNKKQYYNSICNAEDSMDSVTSSSMSLTKSDSYDLDSSSRNSKVSVSSVASISDRSFLVSADDENANSSSERTASANKICSKCNRECKGTQDLYRHMLDCSSDYAWILAKKRNNIKYRYFGTKRRRQQRSSSSSARKISRPKKERRNSDTSASQKSKEPSTPRQRPSDAESIQRMLANLPAKRAARQIFPNLVQKPNNKNKKLLPNALNRKKILLKQKVKGNARGFKVVSTSSTTINSVGTNLALRKRRNVETANAVVRRTRSSLNSVSSTTTPATVDKVKSNEGAGRKSGENTSPTNPSSSQSDATKNKKINDLGSVFHRRTKVTKISNTFRRGQKQRLLRKAHHSPNTSKNTNSAKLDKSKLKAKSKKTFLRTFRRSNRNVNKMNQPAERSANETIPVNPTSDSEKKGSQQQPTTVSDQLSVTSISKSNENVSNPEVEHTADGTVKTPEAARLKRKRSIKTIINEMHAKCQSQTTATSDAAIVEKPKVDDSHSLGPQIVAKSENMKNPPLDVQISTPVTMPLLLTIEPLDEPLNLCISPQKNLSAAHSVKDTDDKSTSSSLQSPESQSDNISPRRRTRKLTDCIAMLTGKLQEKLGVPFIDQSSALLPILSPSSENQAKCKAEAANSDESTSIANNVCSITTIKGSSVISKTSTDDTPAEDKPITSDSKTKVNVAAAVVELTEPAAVSMNEQKEIDLSSSNDDIKKLRSSSRKTRETPAISTNNLKDAHNPPVNQKKNTSPVPQATENEEESATLNVPAQSQIELVKEKIHIKSQPDVEERVKVLEKGAKDNVTPTKRSHSKAKSITKIHENADKSNIDLSKIPNINLGDVKAATDETSAELLKEVESVKKTTSKAKKKKSNKENAITDKMVETDSAAHEVASENVHEIVEIDIENEIKSNIVLKLPPDTKGIKNETASNSRKCTSRRTPTKSKEKDKEIVKVEETDDSKVTEIVKPTKDDLSIEKTKVNRSKRSAKPPLETTKPVEAAEKKSALNTATKTPPKAVKSKENNVTTMKRTAAKEIQKTTKTESTVDAVQSPTETVGKVQQFGTEKPSIEKSTEDISINMETTIVECATADAISVKPANEKPSTKQLETRSSKSKSSTPKKSCKKVAELEAPSLAAVIDPNSSELNKSKDKIDKVVIEQTKESNILDEIFEALPENTKSNRKQSEKSIKTDKNSKRKAKKAKRNEKSVKNVDFSQEIVEFDKSDDELLPWDPEKGFIHANEEVEPSAPEVINSTPVEQESTTDSTKSVPKPKKKRKSELAQIIADQLLESFKEVDQSRVDELKRIQDLPLTENEAELISTSLSTTPIPKRKSKKLFETIESKKTDKVATKKDKKTALSVEKETTAVVSPLDESNTILDVSNPKLEDQRQQSPERIDPTAAAISTTKKSKKEKKSSPKKSAKKDSTKKINKRANVSLDKIDNASIVKDLMETHLNDDINKKSLISSLAPNIHNNVVVDKVSEKSLFSESNSLGQFKKMQRIPSVASSSDTISSDNSEKSKTNSIFAEVLLSQKNLKTERLNDIIGLADKEALSRVPSIKNVVFPQWQSGIDKPNLNTEMEKLSLPKDNKLNFWGRSSPTNAGEKIGKSKVFGVVKNKAKDLFSRISKKKLKKSAKTSMRSTSSSSSSSSSSSNFSADAPKKPLLRPSILSCNNFREIANVTSPAADTTELPATMNDIFDSLRNPKKDHVKKPQRILSQQKLEMRNRKEKIKQNIEANPKSPIETDMNIAKIVIALEKSNQKKMHTQVTHNLNNTFAEEETALPPPKSGKRTITTKAERKSILPIPADNSTSFLQSLQNDDSQDTIISQIVNKIREKAERTDSDDELCLADVAKGLPTKPDSIFPASPAAREQSDTKIEHDTSALVPNLEDSKKQDESNTAIAKQQSMKDSDDDNTNTELIDMDLEDTESVYTTFSQSTSITSCGGRKKRRKKSILSSNKKSKKNRERLFASPSASYLCEICNKSFRNQKGLTTHKTTITHIQKLSEQEFLNAKEKQNENQTIDEQIKEDKPKEEKLPGTEKSEVENVSPVKIVLPPETHDNIQSSVIRSSPVKNNSTNPYVSPNHMNSSGIEPISSPEQSSRFNGTPKHSLSVSTANSRLTLSHEERLFYECCSMLKGSDRPNVGLNIPDLITKPVTPKCNEQPSNIAHAAQSPRSHSSPRPGLPKLDINQFSDISSDSNPAYSCPQVPSSSKTHKVFSLEPTTPTHQRAKEDSLFGARQSTENIVASASGKAARSSSSSSYPHSSTIVRNYPDSYSDMGDSFPSSQDASESENYAQTILDRSNHFHESAQKHSHNTPQKGEGSQYMQASLPHENTDRSFTHRSHLDSPQHSTSSQSSSLSRPRTKAAMKGYENLKVSIPTSGLDLQHALERSPNPNGCKLAALADIALGNDVPFDLLEQREQRTSGANEKSTSKTIKSTQKSAKIPSKQSPLFIVSSDSPKLHSIELKSKSFEATFHVSPKSRRRTQSIGKKTGYKDRKKKIHVTNKPSELSTKLADASKPKDVYDFEESHDSVENEIIPMSHTRLNKAEPASKAIESKSSETPRKQSDDQEDESSYSDRDDYYNFNSVSCSGTEDQENPVEEDESSDRDVTQPKTTKQAIDSQKKCVIMGRIFKNAKKNNEMSPVETREKPAKKSPPKDDLDEIFDNLRNKSPSAEKALAVELCSTTANTEVPKSDTKDELNDHTVSDEAKQSKARKSREVTNLEAEWGMSIEKIKATGVGKRKAQRRCTNRQNKLVETWSSDEYEEFHTTKDIIALIEEAEMKAQRTKAKAKTTKPSAEQKTTGAGSEKRDNEANQKSAKASADSKKEKTKDNNRKSKSEAKLNENHDSVEAIMDTQANTKPKAKKTTSDKFQSEDESDFDEHWNKKSKRNKIRNRRRSLTSHEDLLEKKVNAKSKEKLERSEKTEKSEKSENKARKQQSMSKKQQSPHDITSEKKKAKEPHHSVSSSKVHSKISKDGKPLPRRKRIASEMLYYWSSSSDEDEFGRIENDSENEDEDNSENHLEQHGWIVGDSHKKLVTLLAHAKGKKIEDCGVKESVHKRK